MVQVLFFSFLLPVKSKSSPILKYQTEYSYTGRRGKGRTPNIIENKFLAYVTW